MMPRAGVSILWQPVANGSYERSPTQNCKLNVNIMRMFCDCFKNLIVKFP